MRKFVTLAFCSVIFCLMIGCQHEEEDGIVMKQLGAAIVLPTTLNAMEAIDFEVKVTYGDEVVKDASDVQFEIWEENRKEASELMTAKHVGDGIYRVTKNFKQDGKYFIQAHVTARDQHTMPKKEIVVGNQTTNSNEVMEHEEEHDHEQ